MTPPRAPLRTGAGILRERRLRGAPIAASADSARSASTVIASTGRRPGAMPFAAIWRIGMGADPSRIFCAGPGSVLRLTVGFTSVGPLADGDHDAATTRIASATVAAIFATDHGATPTTSPVCPFTRNR